MEVKEVMNDMLSKVAANYMDTKYDAAILDIVKTVEKYVGTVNDTSSKQYEDFNKNLKEAFGYNMQQI